MTTVINYTASLVRVPMDSTNAVQVSAPERFMLQHGPCEALNHAVMMQDGVCEIDDLKKECTGSLHTEDGLVMEFDDDSHIVASSEVHYTLLTVYNANGNTVKIRV